MLRILVVSYLGLTIFLFLFQKIYVYRPSNEIIATPQILKLEYEEIYFKTTDDVELCGWLIPSKDSGLTVLFCHSNYGNSKGKPSEQGTYRDAEAAWEFLVKKRGASKEKIIILGRSLGSPIAARLAGRHNPAALIIESTFTSFDDMAKELFPYIPVKYISRYDYDTMQFLENVTAPVLFVHSCDDELIPFEHGRELFEAFKGRKSFLEIRGSHNDGVLQSRKKYMDGLRKFKNEQVVAGAER